MKPTRAYILIETLPAKSMELIESIKSNPEIVAVHLVTGPYDVIAYIEAPDLKSIGELLDRKIRRTGFVTRTVTCICVED